jgi:hypothetical protein
MKWWNHRLKKSSRIQAEGCRPAAVWARAPFKKSGFILFLGKIVVGGT